MIYIVEWHYDGIEWEYNKEMIGIYSSIENAELAIKRCQEANRELDWIRFDRTDFNIIEVTLDNDINILYDSILRT